MKKLTIFIMAICAIVAGSANAGIIAGYDASVGNPTVAEDVQSPLDQGLSVLDATLGATDIQEGVIEGGIAAWRNLDGTDNNNPGYVVALSANDYQDMFDYGWTLKITVRLEQGGQFLYWGGDDTNTAGGFAFPGDRRCALSLNASGSDYTATIVSTGSSGAVTITNGITNGTYITVTLTGAAGSTTFDATIVDTATSAVLLSETGLGFANGNSSTDAHTGFMSGSSGGDNREAFYREFMLADHSPAASPLDPANGEIDVPVAEDTVTWAAPFGGNPITGYTVVFAPNDPNFLTNPLTATVSVAGDVLSAELIAAGDMDFNTVYYWRVDTTDDTTAVYESTVSSFTTLPEYPVIIAPAVASVTVAIGDPATLTVAHLNGADFQWYQDGAPVGANDATLTIASTQTTDEGIYHCVVSNGAGTATSGDAVVMTKRQIAHWDFEAASLTDSIDGWVGTFTDPNEANPAPDPAPRFVAGYDGSGFEFAGDALHVEVAGTEELFNFYPQGLTVACWVKATGGTGTYSSMVAKHTYSTDAELGLVRAGYTMTQGNSTGRPRMNVDGWGGMNGPSIVNVQDGNWHHVVMTFDPDYDPVDNPDRTQGRLYVNGGGVTYDVECAASWLRSSATGAGVPDIRWDVPLRIGCDDENGGGSLEGIVDEVKIWTYPLTPTEVAEEYTAYETGANICTDLVDFDLTGPDGCPDCIVSLYDFALFAGAWMDTNLVP